MNLEDLKNNITKDSQIDSTELGVEALKIPQVHAKYLNMLTDFKLLLTKHQNDYAIQRLRKWKILTGKASKEELEAWGEEPFDLDLLKTDVEKFIDNLSLFTGFVIKIVLKSTTIARYPKVKDLRVIALA